MDEFSAFKRQNAAWSFHAVSRRQKNMTPRLRILCLHGLAQNKAVLYNKTAALRKALDDVAEFVYVNAPHSVPLPEYSTVEEREMSYNEEVSEGKMKDQTWYDGGANQSGYIDERGKCLFIYEHLLKQILCLIKGPFDGILGFSQGACFAALLAALLENRSYPELLSPEFNHPPLKFVVLIAGMKAVTQEATSQLHRTKLKTPSLHICGDSDTVVSSEQMQFLADWFDNPVVFKHPGG
ncbi:hypothetical protein EC973_009116 [Apophysomyces ossiformis]|uniref:Serine hydrolase domain-containing protein n=1 Tax=Apophysomyces ossiformis TaxID=679940 RepID=A0A8H7EPR4_9FUNG|nr:hypothetical protein EC973_009116 [Apophysomyces ossiformis]